MYLRIFYRCILIQHSDTYIFSGHVRGDQDLGMQLIAAHLQANLRFIALQFTKLCKTVIQTISSVTASQHHSTFRPREQLAPVLLHDWSDNVSRSADQVGEAAVDDYIPLYTDIAGHQRSSAYVRWTKSWRKVPFTEDRGACLLLLVRLAKRKWSKQ